MTTFYSQTIYRNYCTKARQIIINKGATNAQLFKVTKYHTIDLKRCQTKIKALHDSQKTIKMTKKYIIGYKFLCIRAFLKIQDISTALYYNRTQIEQVVKLRMKSDVFRVLHPSTQTHGLS